MEDVIQIQIVQIQLVADYVIVMMDIQEMAQIVLVKEFLQNIK